jgi:hypothetical protein
MKIILTIIASCLSFILYAQDYYTDLADSCHKRKPLPCKVVKDDSLKIDTLKSHQFESLLNRVYYKVVSEGELTLEEDRIL